jgi:hypothetical protein
MKIFDYIFDKQPNKKAQSAHRKEAFKSVTVTDYRMSEKELAIVSAIKNSGWFTKETRAFE